MRWLAGLAKAARDPDGFLRDGERAVGHVVQRDQLGELRAWLVAKPPKVVLGEQRAVVEACIGMAHANREVDPEERARLRELIGWSGLDEDARDELVSLVHSPPPLDDGLRDRVRHAVLRDVLLSLAWEIALADGSIDDTEEQVFATLAEKLGVSKERADAIRVAVRADFEKRARA